MGMGEKVEIQFKDAKNILNFEIWEHTDWFCARCGVKGVWASMAIPSSILCTNCRSSLTIFEIAKAVVPDDVKRVRALIDWEKMNGN